MSNLVRAVAALCAFAIVNTCMLLGFMYTYPDGPPPLTIIQKADIEEMQRQEAAQNETHSGLDSDAAQQLKAQNDMLGTILDPTLQAWWSAAGFSFHLDVKCSMLRKKRDVHIGTVQNAIYANKIDPCDLCAGG